MSIQMAHLREQGINFAVFNADARSKTNRGRAELLGDLTAEARRNGLRVDKSALMYQECGRTKFFGTPDLVKFLSRVGGRLRWTHRIAI